MAKSSEHSPDGYGLGELRTGVGFGYLSGESVPRRSLDDGSAPQRRRPIVSATRTRRGLVQVDELPTFALDDAAGRRVRVPQPTRIAPRRLDDGGGAVAPPVTPEGRISVVFSPNTVSGTGGTSTGFCYVETWADQTNLTFTLQWTPDPYGGGMSNVTLAGWSTSGWSLQLSSPFETYRATFTKASRLEGNGAFGDQLQFSYGPLNLNSSRVITLSVISASSTEAGAYFLGNIYGGSGNGYDDQDVDP